MTALSEYTDLEKTLLGIEAQVAEQMAAAPGTYKAIRLVALYDRLDEHIAAMETADHVLPLGPERLHLLACQRRYARDQADRWAVNLAAWRRELAA